MSPTTTTRAASSPNLGTPGPRQRVAADEELLERTDQPVGWIAAEVGFGNAAALRHHVHQVRGVSPQSYRRQFAC